MKAKIPHIFYDTPRGFHCAIPEHQLELKHIVDCARCRIYWKFAQNLIADQDIRANKDSGLFYFTISFSYVNFRVSYRRLDGITDTVSPGEWIYWGKKLQEWFRARFQYRAFSILDRLQAQEMISCSYICGGTVKYLLPIGRAQHHTGL